MWGPSNGQPPHQHQLHHQQQQTQYPTQQQLPHNTSVQPTMGAGTFHHNHHNNSHHSTMYVSYRPQIVPQQRMVNSLYSSMPLPLPHAIHWWNGSGDASLPSSSSSSMPSTSALHRSPLQSGSYPPPPLSQSIHYRKRK